MSRRLKLDAAPDPVLLEGDARVLALQAAKSEPRRPEDYVSEIARLWERAQGAFLEIGRLLIRAKEMLPHGEYTSAVEENLPFSGRTAYQLREAARWALEMDRAKTIPVEKLPGSYSTIYLLSTLDPPTLKKAEADGLIRPELKRAELIAWRRDRGAPSVSASRKALLARKHKLQRERERLDDELRRIEAQLTEGESSAEPGY
ncbi:DUF3102 domain-containing protein [Roseomonas populi]|uniref:DUF3102 domain-containing protein n=1 Tax=Roseomonas populi TaxID=3121582 RepID=A0ABT1XD98_9PROT|nr:DUF3102 domain-containing protein [Roseomonas pecuniae]MCR0985413.1 DUF3102 domain-containing protein [Roseomonas pecuniae]